MFTGVVVLEHAHKFLLQEVSLIPLPLSGS